MPIRDVSEEEIKKAEENAEEWVKFPDGSWVADSISVYRVDDNGWPVMKYIEYKGGLTAGITFNLVNLPASHTSGPSGNYTLSELILLTIAFGQDPDALPERPSNNDAGKLAEYINAVVDLINSSGHTVKLTTKNGWVSYVDGLIMPEGSYLYLPVGITSTVKGSNMPTWIHPNKKGGEGKDLERKVFVFTAKCVGEIFILPSKIKPPDDYVLIQKKSKDSIYVRPTVFKGLEENVWIDYCLIEKSEGDLDWQVRPQKGGLTASALRHRKLYATLAPEIFSMVFDDPSNTLPEFHNEILKRPIPFVAERVKTDKGRIYFNVGSLQTVPTDLSDFIEKELGVAAVSEDEGPEANPDIYDNDEEDTRPDADDENLTDSFENEDDEIDRDDVTGDYLKLPLHLLQLFYYCWRIVGQDSIVITFGGVMGIQVDLSTDMKKVLRGVKDKLSIATVSQFNEADVKVILNALKGKDGYDSADSNWGFYLVDEDIANRKKLPDDFFVVNTTDF